MHCTPVVPDHIQGAVSLEPVDNNIKPWRIPYEERGLFYPEDGIQAKACETAGVRVRLHTAGSRVELRVSPDTCARRFDLVDEGTLMQTVTLEPGQDVVAFRGLEPHARTREIWLPTDAPVVLRSIAIDTGSPGVPAPDTRPRWVAYGSSITHCRTATSPARTWPALAARRCGLNLTSLGFGGNCMLEPMVALLIRDLPAEIITLKLGINVHGQSSLSERTYQPAVIGLVRIIRDKHPCTPIGLITPILCPSREKTPNQVGRTLEDYRRDMEQAVERLRECGDHHVHLFDGRELLGEDDTDHLHDGLHPDGDGYQLMGERAAGSVMPELMRAMRMKTMQSDVNA